MPKLNISKCCTKIKTYSLFGITILWFKYSLRNQSLTVNKEIDQKHSENADIFTSVTFDLDV